MDELARRARVDGPVMPATLTPTDDEMRAALAACAYWSFGDGSGMWARTEDVRQRVGCTLVHAQTWLDEHAERRWALGGSYWRPWA